MLTHEEIKKLVYDDRKALVRRGKVWIGAYHFYDAIVALRKKTAEMSLDQLHDEEEAIESQIATAQDNLTKLSVVIHQEEIERIRSQVKNDSWRRALDSYVHWYGEWKKLKLLSVDIREMIVEPSAAHRRTPEEASGLKRRDAPLSSRPRKIVKVEVVDLNKGTHTNELIQAGEGWFVSYSGGKRLVLKNRKGLIYIAKLLSSPNTLIHCDQLLALDKEFRSKLIRDDPTHDDEPGEDSVSEWGETDSFHIGNRDDAVELVDEKAATSYRNRITYIDERLSGKSMAKSVRSKLEAAREELNGLLGKVGKGRGVLSANDNKKMKAVAKAIKDSIQAIAMAEGKEQIPRSNSLAVHLTKAIKGGLQPSYCPSTEIDWRIETKR